MLSGCFVAVLIKPTRGSAWRGGAGQRILGPDTTLMNTNVETARRSLRLAAHGACSLCGASGSVYQERALALTGVLLHSDGNKSSRAALPVE